MAFIWQLYCRANQKGLQFAGAWENLKEAVENRIHGEYSLSAITGKEFFLDPFFCAENGSQLAQNVAVVLASHVPILRTRYQSLVAISQQCPITEEF